MTHSNFPSFGGHNHSNPLPPNIKDLSEKDLPNSIDSGTMQESKEFIFNFKAPKYATRTIWRGKWIILGWRKKLTTDIIDIKVTNLFELEAGTGYVLGGSTSAHLSNHYGTEKMNATLKKLGSDWRISCSTTAADLSYNDMSLPWGGKFDLSKKWVINPTSAHREHQFEINIDIGKRQVKKANRKKLIEMMCNKFSVLSEGDEENEVAHYHLELNPSGKSGWGRIIKFDTDTKATPCCTANHVIPNKCILLYDNGEIDEEPNIPSDCQ